MPIPATPFHESSDKELRSRVKLLGKLVGNVLLKHEKPEVFHAVESLRTGFIQLRKRESEAKRKSLIALISELEPDVISQVVRAFTLYFNLVNIAEEDYLHRLRRESVRQHGHAAWIGSFRHTLEEFKDQGISVEALQDLCNRLSYKPVFTAHPTESGGARSCIISAKYLNSSTSSPTRASVSTIAMTSSMRCSCRSRPCG